MDKGKRPLQRSAQFPVTHTLRLWCDALQAALFTRVTEGVPVCMVSFFPEQPTCVSEANSCLQGFDGAKSRALSSPEGRKG